MHDLPLMDRADVSLAVDGDRQLLPSSRRDSEEKTRARVCRVKNIWEIWIFTPDFSQNCKKTKPKSKYSRFFLYPHPPLLFATKGMVYICSTSLNLSSNVKILKIDSELSVW